MSGLDDRLSAFEAKYAHDEQMTFKVTARRNKLMALWVSEQLDAYIKEVLASDFEEAGDEDVIRKVGHDLDAVGKSTSADDLRGKLSAMMIEAKTQVMSELD